MKRYPREEYEKIYAGGRGFRALIVPVRRASLMCIEKMIDGMSDGCYTMNNQTTLAIQNSIMDFKKTKGDVE